MLYPSTEGAHFDFEYWTNDHLPFITRILGPAITSVTADRGLAGGPDAPSPYIAVGSIYFDTLDDFLKARAPHDEAITNDIKNFTDIQPLMMRSEVLVG